MAPSNGSPNATAANTPVPFSWAQVAKGQPSAPVASNTPNTPAKPSEPTEQSAKASPIISSTSAKPAEPTEESAKTHTATTATPPAKPSVGTDESNKTRSPLTAKVNADKKLNWAEDANENASTDPIIQPNADAKSLQNDPPHSDKASTNEETVVNSEDSPVDSSTPSGKPVDKNDDQPRLPRSMLDNNWRDRPKQEDPPSDSPARSDDASWQEEAKSAEPKPLTEAPPPAVNPWTQRAQMFKVQPTSTPTETKPAGANNTTQNFGGQTRQKAAESSKQSNNNRSDKPGPRGRAPKADTQKPVQSQRARSLDIASRIPAMGDQTSWPTPDTAQVEDTQRIAPKVDKSTDKIEKADEDRQTQQSKPHGRQGWAKMDIIPTVKFETELPTGGRRGGGRGGARGGPSRGGRDGSFRGDFFNNSVGSKTPTADNTQEPTGAFGEDDDTKARLPSSTDRSPANGRPSRRQTESKRAATANNSPTRGLNASRTSFISQAHDRPESSKFTPNSDAASNTNRKPGIGQAPNEGPFTDSTSSRQNYHARRRSVAPQNESTQGTKSDQTPPRKGLNHGESAGINSAAGNLAGKKNSGAGYKAGWNDQKQEGQARPQNRGKEMGTSLPFRDRGGNQRPERGGRAGGRGNGRGNGQTNPTGAAQVQIPPTAAHSAPFQPQASPYAPRSASFNYASNGHQGRGGQRSVSIHGDNSLAQHHPYSYPSSAPTYFQPPQFPTNSFNSNQFQSPQPSSNQFQSNHFPPNQFQPNQFQPNQFHPQGMNHAYNSPTMTSGEMQSAPELNTQDMFTMNGIAHQLNFWFSFDNLLRDEYFQTLMDSQGFVSVGELMSFPRMRALTREEYLVQQVAHDSPNHVLGLGPSGEYRIRTSSDDWRKFVHDKNLRKPSARHEGPSQVNVLPNFPHSPSGNPGFFTAQGSMNFQNGYSHPPSNSMTPMSRASPHQNNAGTNGYPPAPTMSQTTTANHTVENQVQPSSTSAMPQSTTAADSGDTTTASTAPPDGPEKPSQPSQSVEHGAPKDTVDSDDFPDEGVKRLSLLSRNEGSGKEKQGVENDDVQNGVDHGKSMASDSSREEERQPRSLARSNEANDRPHNLDIERIRESFTTSKIPRSPYLTPQTPTLWSIEGVATPQLLPTGAHYEPYESVRHEAYVLRTVARHPHAAHAFAFLYSFWTHFLVSNFNNQMYDEFVRRVHEDIANDTPTNALEQLLAFYSNSLSNSKPMKNKVARDYIDLVENEDKSGERPAFTKLRSDWRNGAVDMRNRKKISDFISTGLRHQLEQ
ncbi:MAG: hypothetical protein M1831_003053 [Alyxoria varia]|nr:MAG: hypothetical protein M1831_003053 [Alyxoria varia]